MSYAEGTTVPVEKTRMEIERVLVKANASHVGVMHEPTRALVAFRAGGRNILFRLPLPDQKWSPKGRFNPSRLAAARDQELRRRWRGLLLTLKAKFEAIDTGIETLEEAFLAHIVLPGGSTVADQVSSRIAESYKNGAPLLLLGSGKPEDASK